MDAADLARRAARGVAAPRGRRVRGRRTPSSTARTCCSSCTTTARSTSSSCEVPAADPPGRAHVVVPHRPATRLLGRVDASATGRVRRLPPRRAGAARHAVDYATGAVARARASTSRCTRWGSAATRSGRRRCIRLGYGSFVTPGTVYDYDVATGELLLRKRQPVLGGYDPDDYAQARVWATRAGRHADPDLARVEALVRRAGDAPRPLHLYGYGVVRALDRARVLGRRGCRCSTAASSSRSRTCAAAARWAGSGTRTASCCSKRNTFTDFVDCARHLVDAGVHRRRAPGRRGRQRRRPADGRGRQPRPRAVRRHPRRRAVRGRADDDPRPVAAAHRHRVGRVGRPAARRRRVRVHEVVHAVRERARRTSPTRAILAVTSLNDTRVLYVEPAKWVARLREVGADALLKCEMVAGHGGVSGRYNAWRERAFELAWLLDVAD